VAPRRVAGGCSRGCGGDAAAVVAAMIMMQVVLCFGLQPHNQTRCHHQSCTYCDLCTDLAIVLLHCCRSSFAAAAAPSTAAMQLLGLCQLLAQTSRHHPARRARPRLHSSGRRSTA
jgi:hypothetical protein